MPGGLHALVPVLGHPRVLLEAGAEPRRRVIEHAGAQMDGVAAWEPLFARHGEGVVALRDPVGHATAARLFHGLLDRAAADGIVLVRFVLLPGQATLAAALALELPGASLDGGDELAVRIG